MIGLKKALLILAVMSFLICNAIAQMAWSDNRGEDMPMIAEEGNADSVYVVPNQNSMIDKDHNRYQETDQWHSKMVDKEQSKSGIGKEQKSAAICLCECEKAVMNEDSYQEDKNKCDYSLRNMDEWSNRDQMDYGQNSVMMSWKGMGQDDNQCDKARMDKDYCGNKMDECDISMRNKDDWGNKDRMDYGQKSKMAIWKGMGQDDSKQCGKVMMDEDYCENKIAECDNSMRNKADWGNKDGMDHGQKSIGRDCAKMMGNQ
jgi:hypothetical protein